MALFKKNKTDVIFLSHQDADSHIYEVKGKFKFFLYIDGIECTFDTKSFSYSTNYGKEVFVKIEPFLISLFIDDEQVATNKLHLFYH